MAIKKDLSVNYLGVKCQNPFFLSSSPVGGNYDMVRKCYETGWAGCFFKTVGIFVADECSPRFDQTNKEGLPWLGFKNMEQISDKPTEQNFEYIYRLVRDYPEHVTVATIMGSSEEEWKQLAKMCDEAGITRFCMHALRHTYATRAMESRMEPKILQELLGHSSIKTTMDRYVHVTTDSMGDAIRQFEKNRVSA